MSDRFWNSSKISTGTQSENLLAIEEEFRSRKGCPISGLSDSSAHSEPDGARRGMLFYFPVNGCHWGVAHASRSKTKLQTILMTKIPKRVSSPMMRKRRNMETSYFFCNPNPGTSLICADLSPCRKLIPFSRPSCSPSTETSTRAEKSIYC